MLLRLVKGFMWHFSDLIFWGSEKDGERSICWFADKTGKVHSGVFYDGHSHPFPVVEGWHAPAGRRTREPRSLAQDGQIGTAPPAVAK